VVKQRGTETVPSVVGMDRDLLDVRAAVQDVHQQVRDWAVIGISNDPCPPALLEDGQVFQGGWPVIGDRVHR
jgi:IS4 transposase